MIDIDIGRDDVGYNALHDYVRSRKPKPNLCERCNKVPPRQLACIKEYKSELENWMYMCDSCHLKFDRENGTRKGPNFGRHHTSETIEIIRHVNLGNKHIGKKNS